MMRELTPADELAAFKAATWALPAHYGDVLGQGMTDAQLVAALWDCLGVSERSPATATVPAIAYTYDGLKIWASWDTPNTATDRPVFKGRRTLAMAREVYAIRAGGES